jgi:hypothetical protein
MRQHMATIFFATVGAVGLSITFTAACIPDPVPVVDGGYVDPATIAQALDTPCVVEDDVNCFWRADLVGNGEGTSFVNIDGHVFPLTAVLAGE